MNKIQTNDWIALNAIIYDIYTIADFDEMRSTFLEKMKMVLDFDAADFYLGSTSKNALENGISYNCNDAQSIIYDCIDYSRGIVYSGKSLVYRETDIMSDEQRIKTEYYQKVYKANNWHFALQMVIAFDGNFLGAISFYRNIGKNDFDYEDVFLADMLKEHLAFRMNQYKLNEMNHKETFSVEEVTEFYNLTRQENRILNMTMDRMSNKEICEQLCISVNTLKKHTLNIYRKVGVNSRLELFKMIKGTK